MKKLINIVFILILIVTIYTLNASKVLLSIKNNFNNGVAVQLISEPSLLFWEKATLSIYRNNMMQKVCSFSFEYTYDSAYDIYEDFDSIRWKEKSIIEVHLNKDGKLYSDIKKEFLFFDAQCNRRE